MIAEKEVFSGDILPAKEAIEYIDLTDLSPPIEVPPIPPEAFSENINDTEREWLHNEIKRLKKEKNALVLAHNYMPPDVQDAADVVGDSLYLAQKGKESNADILCEPAVLFMNQILAVMKKPHQKVLAPDLGALCSLAAHADPNKIRTWKNEHPDGIVVSYVNTYLDVKAESDYCCASANSPQIIKYVFANHDGPVLFLPDVHLGFYAVKLLQKEGHSIDRLWLMMGACHVHDRIRPYHVEEKLRENPGAVATVHPECGCLSGCMRQIANGNMAAEAMQVRSTQGMIKFLKETTAQKIIVATETGNIYPMSKMAPEKTFIPASREAVCAYMKQNTLRKLYVSLRDEIHEITVDPELAEKARRPIQRMLDII